MADRIVVVDDDPGFRDLAIRLLQDWGYDVIGVAGTLEEGLAQVRRLRPDVILADVVLPDGNGFDLAARLRGSPAPVAVAVPVALLPSRPLRPPLPQLAALPRRPGLLEDLRLSHPLPQLSLRLARARSSSADL